MSSQTKQEKKIMDEKIAKVREVVRNVSTNDIVLALHNFELDVERTIHAFCEGGSEGALGAWETGSAAKKRQKKIKSAAAPPATTTVTTTTSRRQVPNGGQKHLAQPSANGLSNGHSSSANTKPADNAAQQQLNTGDATSNKISSSLKTNEINSKSATKQKSYNDTSSTGTTPDIAPAFDNLHLGKLNGESSDSKYKAVQHHSDKGILHAEGDIIKCFQEIRQVLAEREGQLIAQLTQCHQNGGGAQFSYNSSKLLKEIAHLGQVVPAKNDAAPVLTHNTPTIPLTTVNGQTVNSIHSTSHSSLVSSVGEDSGVSQTSPVSQEKNVAQVDNGGIIMQSDALSADQLADLQRRIAETLRSQGIDPSVLSDLASSELVAPRKRAPNRNNGAGNRRDGAGDKNKANGGNKRQVDLSILQ